jgi:hypothetical protein
VGKRVSNPQINPEALQEKAADQRSRQSGDHILKKA